MNLGYGEGDDWDGPLPDRIPPDLASIMVPEYWEWKRENHISSSVSNAQVEQNKIMFHPTFAFGTAAVRGEKPLTKDTIAYWEIHVMPYVYGTSLMFGIGTAEARTLSPVFFENILGSSDSISMGLSHKGMVYHGGKVRQYTLPLPQRQAACIGMLFNGPDRTLSYFVNGRALGTAFCCIDVSKVYFPMVSSTTQRSRFIVLHQYHYEYCKPNNGTVESLMNLCLSKIVEFTTSPETIDSLPLPPGLISKIKDRCIFKKSVYVSPKDYSPYLGHGVCCAKAKEFYDDDDSLPTEFFSREHFSYISDSIMPNLLAALNY